MEETFGVLCRDRKRQGHKRERGRGGTEDEGERQIGVRHVEKDRRDKGEWGRMGGRWGDGCEGYVQERRRERERAVRNIVRKKQHLKKTSRH